MALYWVSKLVLLSADGGIGEMWDEVEMEMHMVQVSKRGGELWAVVKRSERKVVLRGSM
jgi:hypothetical protein